VTGGQPSIDYFSLEDVLQIASGVVDRVQIRDIGLLASAALRPQTSVFGGDAYVTFADKAAALMHSLGRNRALVDGNKRLAWAATRIFCLLNDHDLDFTVDEAEQLVLAVAAGEIEVASLAERLGRHLR
jgi:death-on-curing protein